MSIKENEIGAMRARAERAERRLKFFETSGDPKDCWDCDHARRYNMGMTDSEGDSGDVCQVCRAEQAESRLAEQAAEIERLQKELGRWQEAVKALCPTWPESGDALDPDQLDGWAVSWCELIRVVARAWPEQTVGYSESPMELVIRVINERDEFEDRNKVLEAALPDVAKLRTCAMFTDDTEEGEVAKVILSRMAAAIEAARGKGVAK